MTVALSPDDRRRLASVLARLSSDHAGERDAAALLASRIVRDRDVSWLDLLRSDPPARTCASDPGRSNAPGSGLALCLRHLGQLNGWEQNFVRFMAAVARRTPGQSRKLAEIADALRKNGAK